MGTLLALALAHRHAAFVLDVALLAAAGEAFGNNLRDGMLINQMVLALRRDDEGKAVEPPHQSVHRVTIEKDELDFRIVLTDLIQEAIL